MSVTAYDDYVMPFYKRFNNLKGNTPEDFSNAAFLNFIAEYPEFPIRSGNMEFLQRCFEQHFKQ
jgi:hypothetical protein